LSVTLLNLPVARVFQWLVLCYVGSALAGKSRQARFSYVVAPSVSIIAVCYIFLMFLSSYLSNVLLF